MLTDEQRAAVAAAVWESWGELGSLDLRVGDVIDEDDVKLYQLHLAAIRRAVDLLQLAATTADPSR